jgi:hypothetical protein
MQLFCISAIVFPSSDGAMATAATSTFSIAFYHDLLAQPFGHYGDKRKATTFY